MVKYSAIIADGSYPCATAILQGPSREVFAKAKAMGYDCIQLTIRDVDDYDEKELRSLMAEYHMPISAMATGRVYTIDGLSMGAADEDNRRRCVERLCALADMSSRLARPASVDKAGVVDGQCGDKAGVAAAQDKGEAAGAWLGGIAGGYRCPALVIGAVRGMFRDAPTKEEYYRQFDRSIREVAVHCESIGVPVILEADDHLEADAYLHPAEVLAYVREVNSPALRMYIDVMHLYNEGLDPAEMIRAYANDSYSIDISGEDRVAPMDSKLDFEKIIAAIKEVGFSGYLTFEMPPAPPENNAEKSLAYVRKLYEEA